MLKKCINKLIISCLCVFAVVASIGWKSLSATEVSSQEYQEDLYPIDEELAMCTKSDDGVHNFNVIIDISGDNCGYTCGLCGYDLKKANGTRWPKPTPVPTKIPVEQENCGKTHESKWKEYEKEEATCYTPAITRYKCEVCDKIKEEETRKAT